MSRPESSRRHGCLLMLCIGMGVVVIVCGSFFYIRHRTHGLVQAELRRIRGKGLPSTPAEADKFYSVPEGTEDITAYWMKAVGTESDGPFSSKHSNQFVAHTQGLPYVGSDPVPEPPLPGQRTSS